MTCGQFNQSYFLFFFIWNDFRGLRRSIYPVFHNKWGKIGEKTEKQFIIFLEKVCFSYFLSCDPYYSSCDPLRGLDRWLWWKGSGHQSMMMIPFFYYKTHCILTREPNSSLKMGYTVLIVVTHHVFFITSTLSLSCNLWTKPFRNHQSIVHFGNPFSLLATPKVVGTVIIMLANGKEAADWRVEVPEPKSDVQSAFS